MTGSNYKLACRRSFEVGIVQYLHVSISEFENSCDSGRALSDNPGWDFNKIGMSDLVIPAKESS